MRWSRRALLLAGAAPWAARAATPPAANRAPAAYAVPRRVLALHDSRLEPELYRTLVHKYAAMPLEWLGLTLHYHDLAAGLPPPIWDNPEFRGAISWFPEPCLTDLAGFAAWAEQLVAARRRLVVVGELGALPASLPLAERQAGQARLMATLGLLVEGDWSPVTLGDRIATAEPGAWGFEQPLDPAGIPPFEVFRPRDARVRPWLVVERQRPQPRQSHVAVVSPSGGYIAPGFATGTDPGSGLQRWRVDPFAFFSAAFDLANLPAADATTLCGRRLFFAQVDGDGWRSLSQVRLAGGTRATNAEVLLHRVLARNPALPVTVAPIAAELEPSAPGAERAAATARATFALPQVEIGSHTYSHPFDWNFFADWNPEKEAPYRARYQRIAHDPGAALESHAGEAAELANEDPPRYLLPRAFGMAPFDLGRETAGAARLLEALAPPGKRCALLQWTGNCQPFAAAVAAADAAGLPNINGGDTRCDDDFPSLTAVAPLGKRLADGAVQLHAAASNENTYTENWSNRFFGFRDLPTTWARTGAPRRLKALNLYFHTFSAEREASLAALEANIAALAGLECIPVRASRYARLARGTFDLRLERLGPASWRVQERGGLATLRFPGAGTRMLDLTACTGVLGERAEGEMLYVALDPAVAEPVVALTARRAALPPRPLLVQASWEVQGLRPLAGDGWEFRAEGFGPGEAEWRMPRPGRWQLQAGAAVAEAEAEGNGRLLLRLPPGGAYRLVPA